MDSYQKAWEDDYKSRGRLWGGGLSSMPNLPAGSKVLELGCGDGKTLSSASECPWTMAAIDISSEAVRLGRRTAPYGADFLVSDACQLPFKDRTFDAVFAFHVAGHVLYDDRKKMAADAKRVLKVGGRLFFRDFAAGDMRAGQGEEVEPCTFLRGQGIITHYFTEEEARSLFGEMVPLSLKTHRWQMRVRGRDLLRAEVEAAFEKVS